jgi:hypothetical protein
MDRLDGIGLTMLDGELDLEQYRIPSLPASMYYIPNFITPALEAALLSKARLSQSILRSSITAPASSGHD